MLPSPLAVRSIAAANAEIDPPAEAAKRVRRRRKSVGPNHGKTFDDCDSPEEDAASLRFELDNALQDNETLQELLAEVRDELKRSERERMSCAAEVLQLRAALRQSQVPDPTPTSPASSELGLSSRVCDGLLALSAFCAPAKQSVLCAALPEPRLEKVLLDDQSLRGATQGSLSCPDTRQQPASELAFASEDGPLPREAHLPEPQPTLPLAQAQPSLSLPEVPPPEAPPPPPPEAPSPPPHEAPSPPPMESSSPAVSEASPPPPTEVPPPPPPTATTPACGPVDGDTSEVPLARRRSRRKSVVSREIVRGDGALSRPMPATTPRRRSPAEDKVADPVEEKGLSSGSSSSSFFSTSSSADASSPATAPSEPISAVPDQALAPCSASVSVTVASSATATSSLGATSHGPSGGPDRLDGEALRLMAKRSLPGDDVLCEIDDEAELLSAALSAAKLLGAANDSCKDGETDVNSSSVSGAAAEWQSISAVLQKVGAVAGNLRNQPIGGKQRRVVRFAVHDLSCLAPPKVQVRIRGIVSNAVPPRV